MNVFDGKGANDGATRNLGGGVRRAKKCRVRED
jgi:hypothetical protein